MKQKKEERKSIYKCATEKPGRLQSMGLLRVDSF